MIEKLLHKIAAALDKEKIPYIVIGGQAVLLYGNPRLTRDIDITLGIDTDQFSVIEGICRRFKLKILSQNPEDFARQTKVLPAEDARSKMRVDFILSFSSYEKQAISRSKKVLVDHYPVSFVSLDDIIIHKMLAGRAIDEEDVKNLLIKNKAKLNLRYIRKWLKEFGSLDQYKTLGQKFSELLKRS